MSYQVFARKYRPQNFDSVVGQEHITTTLKNAILQNRLAHAYLFVGPRGTGKTSTARIFAKALNCEQGPTVNPCGVCPACVEIANGNSLNVLEFDAASNTQVDKVRELIIENVKYAPTSGKYKLYIVDEVHMLSNSSFNALLKTLEEPPPHVIFLFATTEVNKVPLTILSRCQRFDMRRIPAPLIAKQLLEIAKKENVDLAVAAAETIAKGAEGGMRDAESMLDQLVAFCGTTIGEQDVLSIFGFTAIETVLELCGYILAGDSANALSLVQEQGQAGKDLSQLMSDLINHLRNLLVAQTDPEGLREELGEERLKLALEQAGQIGTDRLLELIEQFAAAEGRMKWAPDKKLHFEIAVIKAIQTLSQATLAEVLDTLSAIRGGAPLPPAQAPSPKPVFTPRPRRTEEPPAPRPVSAEKPTVPAPAKADSPKVELPESPASKGLEAIVPTSDSTTTGTFESATAQSSETLPMFDEPPVQVAEEVVGNVPAPASSLESIWIKLLGEVRRKRPLISTWLEQGILESYQAGTAVIALPSSEFLALQSLNKPDQRRFLEELFSAVAGSPAKVKVESRDDLKVESVKVPEPEMQPDFDPVADFENDPLINKAIELFKAEIQGA